METFSFGQAISAANEAAKESGGAIRDDIVVTPGKYVAEIVYSAHKSVKNDTVHGVNMKFKIVKALPHNKTPGNPASVEGGVWGTQLLWTHSPAAMNVFFRTFASLGLAQEWWNQFGADQKRAMATAATQVKGKQVVILVKSDDYGPKADRIFTVTDADLAADEPVAGAAPVVTTPQTAPASQVALPGGAGGPGF